MKSQNGQDYSNVNEQKGNRNLEKEMANINGDLHSTELDQKSTRQFVVMAVIGVIVIGLTAKTIIDDQVTT